MTILNIVVIDGKEVLIETLPDKEKLADNLNKAALEQMNYFVEKTA